MYLEFINWIYYLFIYSRIIAPRFTKFKNTDIENIIKRIDKLKVSEIEYILNGCIESYKIPSNNIRDKLDIYKLSRNEVIKLIGQSLFGLDCDKLIMNKNKVEMISNIVKKIENKICYNFEDDNTELLSKNDKYIYKSWGNNFVDFNFRPLIIQIPIRLGMSSIHYYMTHYLKYNYETKNRIGFLSKPIDKNRKTIFFIHGLGFGYIPYIQALLKLEKKYNVIILVLPNISSYSYKDDLLYSQFPELDVITNTIYEFIGDNKLEIDMLLCHSFGTYIGQILSKDPRSTIFKKIFMVDPIIFWISSFKMSLHVQNPLIRNNSYYTCILDNVLSYLIYQCIYLKYVLYRVMFGPDFWIYDEKELDPRISLLFEKSDYIIPAELLANKVRKNDKIKMWYIDNDTAYHGSIIMESQFIDTFISIVDEHF